MIIFFKIYIFFYFFFINFYAGRIKIFDQKFCIALEQRIDAPLLIFNLSSSSKPFFNKKIKSILLSGLKFAPY